MSTKKIKPFLGALGANQDASAMLKALNMPASGGIAERETTTPVSVLIDVGTTEVSQLMPGQTVRLPISRLKRSEYNARVYYNQNEVDETAASMQHSGQQVPAIGYVQGDHVVIVDGGKRLNACISGGIDTLDVKITEPPVSPGAEYLNSREVNIRRSVQTVFDDAVRWQELLDKKLFSSTAELIKALNTSNATFSKTIALNRIPATLQRIMNESPQTMGLSIAYEVSMIFSRKGEGEDQEKLEAIAEEVVQQIQKNELNRNQVIDLIKSKLEGPKQRVRGETTPVAYKGTRGHIKVVPQRGEIELKIKGLDEASLEGLREQIQAILKNTAGQ